MLCAQVLKGIIGQGVFQLAVMYALVFHGNSIFQVPGAMEHPGQPSVHYTIVFNTFVWMQLFNQVGLLLCRHIEEIAGS